MSRKMDSFKAEIAEYAVISAEATDLRRKLSAIEKRQKEIKSLVIPKMKGSTVGSIDNEDLFEIVDVGKSSVTIDRVMLYAPQLADKLIVKNPSLTIKFLTKVVK
ncbi:hypothetical protein SEA_WEASELS2_134 [Rhodococcus phage Weasels2]|uniref:Uncharacterized protein n=1 Tax=Rhodococcus phage Weasels2 TaxID=1897437 RepID=A0A1I9SAB3_9CAUD|nr:hypothetical protein FDH04_gp275 [Rhodococcus phage Weasels2]AOZ63719.1 hypothetical protein SEA_WEASELS2_134 [Rhodococcus phage Weasels2]